jgi:hypothetical protein
MIVLMRLPLGRRFSRLRRLLAGWRRQVAAVGVVRRLRLGRREVVALLARGRRRSMDSVEGLGGRGQQLVRVRIPAHILVRTIRNVCEVSFGKM